MARQGVTTVPLVVIQARNGRTYHGPTLEDALQDMRASAWTCTDRTLRGYMKCVARRIRMGDGTRIRTGRVDHFVADMVQAGHLIIRSTH